MLLLLSVACTSAPELTGPVEPTAPPPASQLPSPSPSPSVSPATIGASGQVRVRSPANGSLLVRGVYPHVDSPCLNAEQPVLTARYPGTLAIRHMDDGTLSVVVTLPFEAYLEGIAEVPPSWPTAALDAQAVAAAEREQASAEARVREAEASLASLRERLSARAAECARLESEIRAASAREAETRVARDAARTALADLEESAR